ncbi:MAG: metallophosphoesterase [Candidatus Electrothrix sp. AR1]|nr:metallophosphoesterase [Candidatus Electrothrix sp. AR1]
MKKILHLTDLHIGIPDCATVMSNIVKNIKKRMRPANDYVIVVSGDLVDSVDDTLVTYLQAKQYIDDLKLAGFDVLVVPGNHDYGTGNHQFHRFVGKFKETFYGDSSVSYPKKDIIGGIAFIGLDTMQGEMEEEYFPHTPKNSRFAAGSLGKRQLEDLRVMLESDPEITGAEKIVVYMHHRPFYFSHLRSVLVPATGLFLQDRRKLKKIIKGKIDLLLFGHRHKSKAYYGKWNIPRIYDGGTSTKKAGKKSPPPHMIIDLSVDQRYDSDGNFYR